MLPRKRGDEVIADGRSVRHCGLLVDLELLDRDPDSELSANPLGFRTRSTVCAGCHDSFLTPWRFRVRDLCRCGVSRPGCTQEVPVMPKEGVPSTPRVTRTVSPDFSPSTSFVGCGNASPDPLACTHTVADLVGSGELRGNCAGQGPNLSSPGGGNRVGIGWESRWESTWENTFPSEPDAPEAPVVCGVPPKNGGCQPTATGQNPSCRFRRDVSRARASDLRRDKNAPDTVFSLSCPNPRASAPPP